MSLDKLTKNITEWGNDKGILNSDRNLLYISNWNDPPAVWSLVNGKKRLSYAKRAYAQLQKTKEEVRELEEEAVKKPSLLYLNSVLNQDFPMT